MCFNSEFFYLSAGPDDSSIKYCQLGRGGGHIPDAEVPKYKQLFDACWNGDAAAVSELSQGGGATGAGADAGDGAATELPVWVTIREVCGPSTEHLGFRDPGLGFPAAAGSFWFCLFVFFGCLLVPLSCDGLLWCLSSLTPPCCCCSVPCSLDAPWTPSGSHGPDALHGCHPCRPSVPRGGALGDRWEAVHACAGQEHQEPGRRRRRGLHQGTDHLHSSRSSATSATESRCLSSEVM